MSNATLLIELLTEELPPKALPRLGETFAGKIAEGLKNRGLVAADAGHRSFASPRRLAVTVAAVLAEAAAKEVTEKLMPVAVALDAEGKPTPALLKKMEAKGIPADALAGFERRMDGKAEALFHTALVPGARLADVLAGIVQEAVKALPIPKVMRWGDGDATFVRPVHKLTMLHGADVVPGVVLDLSAGRTTRGHRFMSRGEIDIATAEAYEPTLLAEGKVIPSFAERRAEIERQLLAEAARQQASIGDYADLLDEVAALVEHPTVYVGEFEAEFLAVPQECLILTMRSNQKYFPLFDATGKLLNRFLIVSNMQMEDASNIITGNQRVVRPRLSDARFFFEQDKKQKLDARLPRLASVVYHNKLGSQLERIDRLEALAGRIAGLLSADVAAAQRAARLAKADLVTDMVGEFPELQGIMGRYYALHDGEGEVVADAVQAHYQPRFAGDALPAGNVACAVALADKLDALVGFFGIGMVPTGDKDPFALRRAALGVLRILMETPLPLELPQLIEAAAAGFRPGLLTSEGFQGQLLDFMLERLKNLLREGAGGRDAVVADAVLALRPTRIDLVPAKLDAVEAFRALPESEALAAANKRIVNILKKTETQPGEPDIALLQEAAEKALFHQVNEIAPLVRSHVANENYTEALRVLAGLRTAVDAFFDGVMVMAEEPLTRQNRLALLAQLAGLMNQVADLSRLSA
ncbi:glycine--tRNA ligase subunit beta [Azoarcus communis]|uniref:Glycine--tRNA ligase beta subunit n=1 Tax=Parazoarcus communis SWub3 = DSM 12120 TaxID=1121029 RepID=A0A323V0H2_9RHOO|nr:glycine--tRNA ligase subunit beta [Parazoarcus communis]NMG48811.1 glycine--tRNA ligase subunit beta [Parazoarcus communis]NMG69531.1 glycine--tRNA ligase subunit beta [Parazoarcus communis SWub3 = DSM 12120]PZA17470.1 glycine--tRNA ligase subunit beta [Azoarcus communis] [Parazoarcus communis SWub3 = DSM 12120]